MALYPEVDCYQLYYCQALYKACEYEDALEECFKIKDHLHSERTKLQVHSTDACVATSASPALPAITTTTTSNDSRHRQYTHVYAHMHSRTHTCPHV